jgi:Uri superfamily endonuclease
MQLDMHLIHTYMRACMHAYTGTYIMFLCCLVIHRDILVSEHVHSPLMHQVGSGFSSEFGRVRRRLRSWMSMPEHWGNLGK